MGPSIPKSLRVYLPVLLRGLFAFRGKVVRQHSEIYDEIGAFTTVPNELIDVPGMSDQAFRLAVLLRRYTNNETGKAFPSYNFLQSKTGWTHKTIAKAIKELEASGWILREKQFSGPTKYTVKKPQFFPVGSGHSTSRREERALPVGKSKKTNTKKTNNSLRSGSTNPHYDCFASAYRRKFDYPYQSKQADFVRYNAWKKLDAGLTSDALFEKAVDNYMASPQGKYTFADLVTRFAVFRNSALDRFGKPVASEKPPTPSSAAPLPPLSCDKCVEGWIMPTQAGEYAKACQCRNS